MHSLFFIAALLALTATSSVALAQVPPDIAEGIRKIGPINDPPRTAKLYAPLFADHKEPYRNVTVVSFIHGGGFERGDKGRPGSPFYDNIMLWLTRQGMVGVNMNHRLAPKHV